MSHKKKQLALTKSLMLESLFGPAPILENEDSRAYDAFLERVAVTVAPADVIEEMFVRHFVDLSWENNRYAALKAAVIKAAIPNALRDILAPLVDGRWRLGAIDVYDDAWSAQAQTLFGVCKRLYPPRRAAHRRD